MLILVFTLYLLSLYISGIHSAVLTEKVKVQCPILNIKDIPVQQNFDINQDCPGYIWRLIVPCFFHTILITHVTGDAYPFVAPGLTSLMEECSRKDCKNILKFSGFWYVHATTTFIFGDLTEESEIRDITQEEDGDVTITFAGYYPHIQTHCVISKKPTTTEYGVKGRYKDEFHHFYITVYTDYNYAMTYICFDNNYNEKCEHKEIQIEIWSRTQDSIPETDMQKLELIAAEHLCVNTSDFVIIGSGICDPNKLFSPSTNQSETHNCDSSPCQHTGICAEEDDGSYQCMCPAEYSGMYCEITCPINAITPLMAHPDFDMEKLVGLWYVHSSATSTGNSISQSMFREVKVVKNGNVTLIYGGYDSKRGLCIQNYQSGLQKEGQPGHFEYGFETESVFTYTDYHYTIVFWLHSTTVNDNQEGLEFETQVEIWSKSKDPIPSETMWYLKRKAEQTLCVQMVDFIDQQLGLCDR